MSVPSLAEHQFVHLVSNVGLKEGGHFAHFPRELSSSIKDSLARSMKDLAGKAGAG